MTFSLRFLYRELAKPSTVGQNPHPMLFDNSVYNSDCRRPPAAIEAVETIQLLQAFPEV
jgi:hypothetical protein